LVKGVQEYLEKLFINMGGPGQDVEVKKVNVLADHVPMVVLIPPRVSVVKAVKYMKSSSGKKLKEKF